jgi:hypothetical protein
VSKSNPGGFKPLGFGEMTDTTLFLDSFEIFVLEGHL